MKHAFLFLVLAGCAPVFGDVTVSIAPVCGVDTRGTASNVATRCDTSIMIEGKSDPILTASTLVTP